MVERSEVVTVEHLDRALALTEHARRGIAWIFGSTVGSDYADMLLRNLREFGRMRRTTITRELIRDPLRRQAAIDELIRLGLARIVKEEPPGGRGGATYWLESTTDFQSISNRFPSHSRSKRPISTIPGSEPPTTESVGTWKSVDSEHESLGNRSEMDWNMEIDGNRLEIGQPLEPPKRSLFDYHGHQTRHVRTRIGRFARCARPCPLTGGGHPVSRRHGAMLRARRPEERQQPAHRWCRG
jgi:hypothetical protein